MNVGELIAELQKYPATARVIASGYEGGFDDVVRLKLQPMLAGDGHRQREGKIWGGPYVPREGLVGEHTSAAATDRSSPAYEVAVFIESNWAS